MIRVKTSFLTSKKRGTTCPNWGEGGVGWGGGGGGGGEVISAMPERKHFFYRRASLRQVGMPVFNRCLILKC